MSAARTRTPRGPSAPRPGSPPDVLVVGGGVVGLAAAWRAVEAGLAVTLLDPDGARGSAGAVHAAAGMLAAVSEAEHGEHALARVNVAAAGLWPAFAHALEDASGVDVGLVASGTLTVAYDAADAVRCRELLALQRSWGLDVHEVTAAGARKRVPLLGPHVSAATWAAGERQVDPRAVVTALRTALGLRDPDGRPTGTARVRVVEGAATGLVRGPGGDVVGVRDRRGEVHPTGLVVLAAGAGSASVVRDEPDVPVPVRPVLGATLRLDAREVPGFRELPVVRGSVQHRPVYVVPRPGGEVVVGATSDEREPTPGTRAGDVFALLRDARALLPGLDELPLVDVTTRARPATPDHLPLVGAGPVPGLVLATGHHRNGVLQTPLTAAALDALFAGEPVPDAVRACDPARFVPRVPAPVPVPAALPVPSRGPA
ncbi:FAD-dependent oxidoreductase [Cellulomonas sp. NS3]|uniref:FAD-dependent oxidoreductase n=1 Tax=Cellulomonas sp. NS3 TaxID=2973977 RepID=UPI002163B397|nr:FAD-dependent oxidoreductase [Cellulomonas sp. NS3]